MARLLGISRQRLSQLRSSGDFPVPVQRVGAAYVWQWEHVDAWLESRRGDRPEVHPALERRARQLERLGYRVSVVRDDGQAAVVKRALPALGSGRWHGWISMRGDMAVGTDQEYETPDEALLQVLRRFEDAASRRVTTRDIEARKWELIRRGWREGDEGLLSDTTGNWSTHEMHPPDGGPVVRAKGESPLHAKQRVIEQAEDRQAEIDGEDPR